MRQSIKRGLVGCLLAVTFANGAVAEPRVIFLVRHAERADAGGQVQADPELSATGLERAVALVRELKDGGIRAILTSEFKRARQTAAPLAESLGIKAEVVAAKDTAATVARLENAAGNVLVVGHSNTIPEVIRALGVTVPVTIGEKDYDDLFVVVLAQPPHLLHLHYR
jgi:broad specificity phosphatase PhoE